MATYQDLLTPDLSTVDGIALLHNRYRTLEIEYGVTREQSRAVIEAASQIATRIPFNQPEELRAIAAALLHELSLWRWELEAYRNAATEIDGEEHG